MSSPSGSPGSAGSGFRVSPARICSIAFTVFILVIAYCRYIDYCVLQPVYVAKSEMQIARLRDPASPDPVKAEIEYMSSPDVMAPIITDLQLDKVWAKRVYKSGLDTVPMQDALSYLGKLVHIQPVTGTHIVTINVASEVPKEASDLANAIPNRYQTVRENDDEQVFIQKERILNDQIAQQQKAVDQKAAALQSIRAQLKSHGIQVDPGAAGLIATDLAAQKSGNEQQFDALAPLRAVQAQLDAQQIALDNLQLQVRQARVDHQLNSDPVQIISLAEPPEFPSTPNHSLDLMVAIIEAIVLAIIAAILGEFAFWYLARITPPRADPVHLSDSPLPASAEY